MKRVHWWSLLGVTGAGLAALLWGQTVLGQPDMKSALPVAPPMISVLPETPPAKYVGTGTAGQLPLLPTTTLPVNGPQVAPPTPLEVRPPAPLSLKTDVAPLPQKTGASVVALDVPPGRQQPGVTIEWGGPSAIRIHQPMACQLVVRSTSTASAQNVIVRHRLATGVTCKTSEPAAANEGGELVWNLGTIAPEQTRRIDLTLVSQTRGTLNYAATVTFTAVTAHHVQVREPQLAVKMTGPEKVIAGENVTMIFAISNPGDGVAEAIKLKTVLPDGFDHPRGKVIEFEVGNLAPKESKLLQLVCQAKGTGSQKCTIALSGDGGLAASDSTQVEILTPKLDIAMSGPKLRYLDRHAVYVLKVTNPGTATASNVEVQKLIPAGFKFHTANQGGQYQAATRLVSWNLGELQPGQTKDIAIDLIPTEAGEHHLTAQAKAARGLKSEADTRTLVEGLPALYIDVTHLDDPIEVGAETAYEIRLINTGTKVETNVEVVCMLPAQLEFKGAKCSTTLRYRQEGRDLIFEPLAKLAPKAEVTFKVQVRGIAPGDIRFRTRIKSDGLKDPILREDPTRIYSDDAPTKAAPSVTSTPTPAPIVPTPTPAPIAPTPTPAPAPLPLPMSGASVPLPAPTPTPAPVPLPMPGASVPLPAPTPTPAPLPLPMPGASVPLPARTPTPAPLPLPMPGASVPLPAPTPTPAPVPLPVPGASVPLPAPTPLPSPPSLPLPGASTPLPTLPAPATLPMIPGKS